MLSTKVRNPHPASQMGNWGRFLYICDPNVFRWGKQEFLSLVPIFPMYLEKEEVLLSLLYTRYLA